VYVKEIVVVIIKHLIQLIKYSVTFPVDSSLSISFAWLTLLKPPLTSMSTVEIFFVNCACKIQGCKNKMRSSVDLYDRLPV